MDFEGLPLHISKTAAIEYLARSNDAIAELNEEEHFKKLQILTNQVIAAVQIDLSLAEELSNRVEDLVHLVGSDEAKAYGLLAWGFAHPAPEYARERLSAAKTIIRIATEHGLEALFPAADILLLVAHLELGEINSIDAEVINQHHTASPRIEKNPTNPALWFSCLRSILDGDIERADRESQAIFAASEKQGTDALALYTAQQGMISWMRGEIHGAEDRFLTARREYPEQLLWPVSLAWLWLLQGRLSSAESLLKTIPAPENIPHDRYWLSTITVLAEIARMYGSEENAKQLREALLPFAEHLVPVGVGIAFWGTCARTLGLLEEHLGMLDEAFEHLKMAVELAKKIGALAWLAEALIELAEFAIRHDLSEVDAYQLLAEAKAISESRGFIMLAMRSMTRPRIRVLGQFEVISLCGKRAKWTSKKARDLLKILVANRGVAMSREVVMDILWPGESPDALWNRFAVAVNVIRRALDPERLKDSQHFVTTQGDSLNLNLENLDIDLENFFALANHNDDLSRVKAASIYLGAPFVEEPYADWAAAVRDQAEYLRATLPA